MIRVAVLGASGMLGSMVVEALAREPTGAVGEGSRAPGARRLHLLAAARDEAHLARGRVALPAVEWVPLAIDGATGAFDEDGPDGRALASCEWIVNAVGVTKPAIDEGDPASVARAHAINALFPEALAAFAAKNGSRVIQIATDAVYSGRAGARRESDAHDPTDVYGRTKSRGESRRACMCHLRCSIVGPESRSRRFLLDWVRLQPRGARLPGFTNHRWNGVTTLSFARVCRGITLGAADPGRLHHLVPADAITKHDLVRAIAAAYGRADLVIEAAAAPEAVDRTLATADPARNAALWRAAGYPEPPTIAAMLQELAAFARPPAG